MARARGILGSMFDLNRDGKLDAWERAMEMSFLDDLEAESNNDDEEFDNFNDDHFDEWGIL